MRMLACGRAALAIVVLVSLLPGAEAQTNDWKITFDAERSGVIDKGRLILGSAATAQDGLDPLDEPYPQALPDRFIDVHTFHATTEPGWTGQSRPAGLRYRAEYVPQLDGADRTIPFVLSAAEPGDVDLRWTIEPGLQLSRYFVELIDIPSGTVIVGDMWSQPSYAFPFPSGPASYSLGLRLRAGRPGPPTAHGRNVAALEDQPITFSISGSDFEDCELTFAIVTPPASGSLGPLTPLPCTAGSPNVDQASLTYTPGPDFNGTDSFTFKVSDAGQDSLPATVYLNVAPVNDPPVAQGQSVSTDEDTPLTITLQAADIDGDQLTYLIDTQPTHGTVQGSGPGVTYTPEHNYSGPDSFRFKANDGQVDSNAATVDITVNPVFDYPEVAFTVPGPPRNPAVYLNNLSASIAGAFVSEVSNQSGASSQQLIDESVSSVWQTTTGNTSNQYVTVTLPGGIRAFDRVRIFNNFGGNAVRDFEVWVSTGGGFTRVLEDRALAVDRIQEFPLGYQAQASSVKLLAVNNYGGTILQVGTFEVVDGSAAGVPIYFAYPPNVARTVEGGSITSYSSVYTGYQPGNLIDGTGTGTGNTWYSANGQPVAGQYLVVKLSRGKKYPVDRIRIVGLNNNDGVKDFHLLHSTDGGSSFSSMGPGFTAARSSQVQEFPLGATYTDVTDVKLVIDSNYGTAGYVGVNELEIPPVPFPDTSVSSYDSGWRPEGALDSNSGSAWYAAAGKVTNQSIELRLAGQDGQLVEGVRLQSDANQQSIKEFDVLVSDATDADADFVKVLSGTYVNDGKLQTFAFDPGFLPTRAKYVKLLAKNNWGNTTWLRVSTFEVVASETQGNIISLSKADSSVARNESPAQIANGAAVIAYSSATSLNTPDKMLDYSSSGMWQTTSVGTPQNPEYAEIQLAGGPHVVKGVQLAGWNGATNEAVKDFEVWVAGPIVPPAQSPTYSLALPASAQNNGTLQTFLFPAVATDVQYVKYVPLTPAVGTASRIRTLFFDVIAENVGGVVDFSTQQSSLSYRPELALDGATTTAWRTASNQVADQWVTLRLPGPSPASQRIYGVRINPEGGFGPRNVDVLVSRDGGASYQSEATATDLATNAVTALVFREPIAATHVRFFYSSGWSTSFIGTREVDVLAAPMAGAALVGVTSGSGTVYNALDVDATSDWTTAGTANQSLTLLTALDRVWIVDHLMLVSTVNTDCPKDFELQVSTTTNEPASFTPVLSGTMRRNGLPQHFFFPPAQARYVKLVLENNYGNASSIRLSTFWLMSPEVGLMSTRFIDRTTSVDSPVASYAWTFGDGGASVERDPAKVYAGSGTYPVSLEVTTATQHSASRTQSYIAIGPPDVSFTVTPSSPNEGQTVTFTDTSDPSIIIGSAREWSFGDGSTVTSNQVQITHVYRDNGDYTVTLSRDGLWGVEGVATQVVSVANVPPTVEAGKDWRWYEDKPLTFTPSITEPPLVVDTHTCVWSFGDGTPDSTSCTFSHTYPDVGTYTASLTVTDDDGAVVNDSLSINVVTPAPPPGGGTGGGGNGVVVSGTNVNYTLDADFDQGRFVNLNHDAPNVDQLQLNLSATPLPFVNIAASGRGTVVRIDVNTGAIVGEYYTSPAGMGRNPSRTTVDLLGNVWVANRNEGSASGGENKGSVTRVGILLGGDRVDASGSPDPAGQYLKPPFEYNTCVDRNGDGLIKTSRGLANILPWTNAGGADTHGGVSTADDECVINYVRVAGAGTRTVAVDANNDLWTGGWSDREHEKVDGVTGLPVPGTKFDLGCGGYGGLIDDKSVLWSSTLGSFMRYDTGTSTGACMSTAPGCYGLGIDPNTHEIWTTNSGNNTVNKLNAAGARLAIYPTTDQSGQPTDRGLAVDAAGNVWIGHSGGNSVGHIRTDGTLVGDVPLLGQSGAAGIAVDTNGKIWSANFSDSASRIDPAIGRMGNGYPSGWVDLTVSLGSGSNPYNYSDMTGYVSLGSTAQQGIWTVVQDGGVANVAWGTISWNAEPQGSEPPDTDIVVEARTANTQSGLASAAFVEVQSGVLFNQSGRYIEVRATLRASPTGVSPVLSDIRVRSQNTPPVAHDQTVPTAEDTPVAITLTATDPDSDPLTFSIVSQPGSGTLSGTPPSLIYTPALNFTGVDTFTFKANDGIADSNVATITIPVGAVNDPPSAIDQALTTDEDTPLSITLTGTDPENDPLTFSLVPGSGPTHGTLTGNPPSLVYTPSPDYYGPDSFRFVASDGQLDSNEATIGITVLPVNDRPIADPQAVTVLEDTSVSITLTGSDVENDPITFRVTSDPQHGTLTGTAPDLVYAPYPNYNGPDAFTFVTNDGFVDSLDATVSITVTPDNDLPVAQDQSVTTPEDTPIPITLVATDVDGDPLTFIIVTQPQHGTLTGSGGNVVYSPALNYYGPDAFTFKVNDGQGDSNVATVTITVTPVNDPPVAYDQAVSTREGVPVAVSLLADDVEDDPLSFFIVTGPSGGSLSGMPPSMTYTPNPGFSGTDTFTFRANDGQADSNLATVTITVIPNTPPVANGQSVTTDEDIDVAITLTGSDADGDPLTFIVLTQPAHGTLSGTAPNVTYSPALNYNGPDLFTFKVNDGKADSNLATVDITVNPVNDPPVADDQSVSTPEDTDLPITLTGSDVENDPLTFTILSDPAHGSLTGAPPNVVYHPDQNFNGQDVFAFDVNDGQEDSNVGHVTITVTPVNDPPVADDKTVTTDEDTAVAIILTGSDVEGAQLTYSVLTAPAHGSLSGTAPNLTYTPARDYHGADGFTYKVSDGQADSNVATVSITVRPVNDAPVANNLTVTTQVDIPVSITLTATDVEGDPLTYSVVTSPAHGTLSGAPPGVTYTPAAGYVGPDSFTYKANDGQLDSNVATVSITVKETGNKPPDCTNAMIHPSSLWPPNHKMEAIQVLGVTDPDGDAVTIQVTAIRQDEPTNGLGDGDRSPDAILSPPQVRAERQGPPAGNGRVYHVTFTASDGKGGECTGTATLCVQHDQGPPPQCIDGGPLYDSTQP